jgi:hypothetical protein
MKSKRMNFNQYMASLTTLETVTPLATIWAPKRGRMTPASVEKRTLALHMPPGTGLKAWQDFLAAREAAEKQVDEFLASGDADKYCSDEAS